MFIGILVVIGLNWKQPGHPSTWVSGETTEMHPYQGTLLSNKKEKLLMQQLAWILRTLLSKQTNLKRLHAV